VQPHPLGHWQVGIEYCAEESMRKAVTTDQVRTFGNEPGGYCGVERWHKLVTGHSADAYQRLQVKLPPNHTREGQEVVTCGGKRLQTAANGIPHTLRQDQTAGHVWSAKDGWPTFCHQ
jgi:hypothetical protein